MTGKQIKLTMTDLDVQLAVQVMLEIKNGFWCSSCRTCEPVQVRKGQNLRCSVSKRIVSLKLCNACGIKYRKNGFCCKNCFTINKPFASINIDGKMEEVDYRDVKDYVITTLVTCSFCGDRNIVC